MKIAFFSVPFCITSIGQQEGTEEFHARRQGVHRNVFIDLMGSTPPIIMDMARK